MTDKIRDGIEGIIARLVTEGIMPSEAIDQLCRLRDWDTQTWVDNVVHYRNLAIVLGARPDQMLDQYDRDLVVNHDPNDMGGWDENTPMIWGRSRTVRSGAAVDRGSPSGCGAWRSSGCGHRPRGAEAEAMTPNCPECRRSLTRSPG